MIFIETERVYSVYARTNRRVKWRYSEYCGRWETVEKAIAVVKERFSGTTEKVEFLVENLAGETVSQGFIENIKEDSTLVSRIDKHTKIEEAKEILHLHGIENTQYTMFALGLAVTSCDYIEVTGFGRKCKLNQITNTEDKI